MELVDGQGLPRAEQHTVGAGGQAGVAEPHKPPDLEALPGQHARHWVGRAVGVLQCPAQVQKAAALGYGGQAALHGAFYGGAQGGVRGQPGGVQLWVAARQVKPADVIRQDRVGQRAEKAQLRAVFPQCLQRFGVGKAERGVPCHGKAHPRRGHRARRSGGRGAVKQGVQQQPVDGLLRGIG